MAIVEIRQQGNTGDHAVRRNGNGQGHGKWTTAHRDGENNSGETLIPKPSNMTQRGKDKEASMKVVKAEA